MRTQSLRDHQQDEAIKRMREWVRPGDTLYTSLAHVSRSGMMRVIKVIRIKDNQPQDLSYNVALALGWGFNERLEGVKVQGAGMDMGFHLVYTLAGYLFPGYQSPETRKPELNGCTETGGYALTQRWI